MGGARGMLGGAADKFKLVRSHPGRSQMGAFCRECPGACVLGSAGCTDVATVGRGGMSCHLCGQSLHCVRWP
jgi:hypothetical protein